ncbi:Fc.00g002140.m01.CDS01 [Cosmosporella sp. VM-42]
MSSGPRRAAIACTYCRHRKRRCDGRTPQCRTCREKRLDCTYTEPILQRSDDGHAEESQSRDSQRLEAIESRLREHSEAIETLKCRPDFSTSQSSPATGHEHPRSDSARSLSVSNNASFSFWAFNQTGLGLSTPDADETPPLTIPLGHQTSTSNLLVLPQLKCLIGDYPDEFNFRVEDRRPRSAASRSILAPLHQAEDTPFIDKEVADVYLESYLNLEYPFHPFIDRGEIIIAYEEIMNRGLGLDVQSALIFSMLGIGATAADPIDRNAETHSGDYLIQQALRILYASWTLSFSGDLVVAQGLVLCALYFSYTVEPLMGWRLIHMASTNIQQILAR